MSDEKKEEICRWLEHKINDYQEIYRYTTGCGQNCNGLTNISDNMRCGICLRKMEIIFYSYERQQRARGEYNEPT